VSRRPCASSNRSRPDEPFGPAGVPAGSLSPLQGGTEHGGASSHVWSRSVRTVAGSGPGTENWRAANTFHVARRFPGADGSCATPCRKVRQQFHNICWIRCESDVLWQLFAAAGKIICGCGIVTRRHRPLRATAPSSGRRSRPFTNEWMEVRAGIEPAYADLQSAASPLCHRTGLMEGARYRTWRRGRSSPA
jgi:hypothetical protein